MKIRTRILSGFFLITITGFYFIIDFIKNDIRPRYLEAVEESLNDTVNIITTMLEIEIKDTGSLDLTTIKTIFKELPEKKISSRIYSFTKKEIDLNIYITDKKGIVIYDSNEGKNEGKDFSKWNDVHLTLKGKYGARSSRQIQNDPSTNALYVSAPIKVNNKIAGVVTVVKPENSVSLFIELAKRKIILVGLLTSTAFLLLTFIMSIWIYRPIKNLIEYVKKLKTGDKIKYPQITVSEINDVGLTFEEMREELEGKKYIEDYVQSLTHELKSPLSSIAGAAELLNENLPDDQKKKFSKNILKESQRINIIIQKLLQLSELENRKELNNIEQINLYNMIDEIKDSLLPQISKNNTELTINIKKDILVEGEKFLITHAMINLIKNAVQFSENEKIIIFAEKKENFLSIIIKDSGSGIPDYAIDKIFNKFYSLPFQKNEKGTGLGLPFVKEAALLHNGKIEVKNNDDRGVTAIFSLPV